jgi:electron transport complex protein RnfE
VKTGDFPRSLWGDNPLLAYLVGLCPALAVSNRLANALLLGAVMLFALLGTGVGSVALERLVPPRLRLPSRLLLASALVSAARHFLWALDPTLGAGLALVREVLGAGTITLFPVGHFRGLVSIRGLPPARVLAAAPGALLLLGYASALVRRWKAGKA